MTTMDKVDQQVVDAEVVMDYLVKQREFILTVKTEDLEFIKGRLSQAKFKRDITDRMTMRSLDIYPLPRGSAKGQERPLVTDLHIKLGSGTEIFVVKCSPVDNEL